MNVSKSKIENIVTKNGISIEDIDVWNNGLSINATGYSDCLEICVNELQSAFVESDVSSAEDNELNLLNITMEWEDEINVK